MNETVKTILDKLDKIKDFCDDIDTIISVFQYKSIEDNTCNPVEYKQLKQDIRGDIKAIDNILEELNAKVFNCQLEKIKTDN